MTGHPGTERADPIAGDVRAVWRDSHERYGARKIKAALEKEGRHRVQETHRQHHARTGHDERVCVCSIGSGPVEHLELVHVSGWF